MQNKLIIALLTTLTVVLFSHESFSEEKTGWLRQKIKERLVKKAEEQPEPEASTDVTAKIEKPGDYVFKIKHNDLSRFYKIHVPKNYNAKNATALLLAFHGGGGDMNIQSTDEYYRLVSKSDKEGFIAVFPNGISPFKSGKIATWNAGKCCGGARDKNVDDVGFIKEVVKNVSQQLNIDSKKIFASGMSNGAMISYRLACELSGTFKAITAVAGTDNTNECKPGSPVSILHIHAKDDDHVLFNGGAGVNAFKDRSQVNEFVSVPDTISKWIKLNNCETTPVRVFKKSGAYCDEYAKCKNNSRVKLCVTEAGGHSWPGGKKPRNVGGKPTKAISATDMMWDFFIH